MCKKLDDLVKEETKKAENRGRTEGKFETTLDCIKSLMASMKLNFEDAASKLNVSKEELPKYKEYLFS